MFTSVLQVVHSVGGLSLTVKCLNALQGLSIPDLKHLKKYPGPQGSNNPTQSSLLSGSVGLLKKGPSFSNWDCPPTRYSCISHSGRSLALTSTFSHTSQTSSSARRSRTYRCATISQVELWFSSHGQPMCKFISGDNYQNEQNRMQQLLQ